jgi:eukaryotic-like serine/threonine-protein kinase
MIGKTLGHYQITSQLGKGGMGEVYQARDQKLGRDVALKVLPEEFAKDADRVARFQREAKLLASLNHPNIASIHGLEESGGTSFLVLELIEGETLADRLKRGPVPVEESLKLALQTAEALEAAHEKSVIHRDLKPSNIKLTPEGKVKVLDFGLAKAYAGDREEVNLSNSPTLSDAATQQGVILGTAAYMSPEQARGKPVDKRADIWAFGCVLFETLAGRSAFSGKDVTDLLAAVIRSEPEWGSLPANLHWRLREVLERCLKKDARERYHDISDVKADIQRVLTDPSGVLAKPLMEATPRVRLRTMLPWLAAALVLGAIGAGIAVWRLKQPPSPEPRRVIRLEHNLPEGQLFNFSPTISGHLLAVSPDGSKFIYSTAKGLYLRSVDELNAGLIAGTGDNPQSPFFSFDGQWVGYWSQADSKLKKIAVRGGAPVTLCDVTWLYGAIWYPDNTIVYADVPKGVLRVSANGGTPEALVKGYSLYPQLLPDGKSILFTDVSATPYRIIVQTLESGKRKELFAGFGAQYLPTGHLVYELQNNNLFAIPFDLRKLEVTGGPVPIVEGVGYGAISDSGTLVYMPFTGTAGGGNGRTLVWVDRKGKEEPLEVSPNLYRYPRFSPDGTKVAIAIIGDNSDIWIRDLARKTLTRLTFDESSEIVPVWSPDGKRIAFYSDRNNKFGIYWKAADGTGEVEQLCSASAIIIPYCWSSDGNALLTGQFVGDGMSNQDVSLLSTQGDPAVTPLLRDKYMEMQARISPDGRWMAYTSNESGKNEIYVRPFPDVNKGRWQVSTDGGDSPLWSPDGREIFYLNGDAVMAVPVETKAAFSLGTPKPLFHGKHVAAYPADGTPWDISPDGKRFLMIKPPASPGGQSTEQPRKLNIVLNWTEELKQRVPVK